MIQFSADKQVLRFLKKVCEESGGFTENVAQETGSLELFCVEKLVSRIKVK